MRVLLTSLPIRSHLMPTVLPDVPAPEDFGPPPWKPEVDGVLKVPLFAGQPRNAARVAELKAGVTVDVKGLTATAPAEKIKYVLAASTYHDAAETMAGEMAELPLFTDIPDHLVSAV